jgi:hypothetical protein
MINIFGVTRRAVRDIPRNKKRRAYLINMQDRCFELVFVTLERPNKLSLELEQKIIPTNVKIKIKKETYLRLLAIRRQDDKRRRNKMSQMSRKVPVS